MCEGGASIGPGKLDLPPRASEAPPQHHPAVPMATVAVVNSDEVKPRPGSVDRLSVRPTLGPQTGFDALQQAVLECAPGHTDPIQVSDVEETLFVLAGRGTVHVAGD